MLFLGNLFLVLHMTNELQSVTCRPRIMWLYVLSYFVPESMKRREKMVNMASTFSL